MNPHTRVWLQGLVASTNLLNESVMQPGEDLLVGGQAVIEGVMMRSPHSFAIAVHREAGDVAVRKEPVPRVSEKYPVFKLPVFRGVGILGQAFVLGMKAIKFSADQVLDSIATAEAQKAEPKKISSTPPAGEQKKSGEIGKWFIAVNAILATAFFIFLFKFLPLTAATYFQDHSHWGENRILFNLMDGLVRLVLFVGYIGGIGLWKEFRRLYEYHGAEHKVVYNFENGKPLTVENARQYSTLHPRCGTSFLLTVMLVSIVVYTFIPFHSFGLKLLFRILLLPVIMGLSYEVIKFSAKKPGSLFAMMTAPGLWLQKITTRPPSDAQLSIGIRALEEALSLEHAYSSPKG
ncbi:MAG: DUF1385 domain-containing protein [Acidobacteriia bacterium]|nr:DUF1385 domain-containing protein [Terriglobia bacterium]